MKQMVFIKIVLSWLKITEAFENKVQKLTLHIVADVSSCISQRFILGYTYVSISLYFNFLRIFYGPQKICKKSKYNEIFKCHVKFICSDIYKEKGTQSYYMYFRFKASSFIKLFSVNTRILDCFRCTLSWDGL